jgi:hypothetical protein
MSATIARKLGLAPPTPSPERRREALAQVFGYGDLDLSGLPRAQLVQLVWRMLGREPDLALCPSTVGCALDLLGRDFDDLEPALYKELLTRLYREQDQRWLAYRSLPIPTRSWRTTMSPIHSAIYRACYPDVEWVDDLMEARQLSRRLAMMDKIVPGILAPERWRDLARVMPPRLHAIADAKARAQGAPGAAALPLIMIETIENASIEDITRADH